MSEMKKFSERSDELRKQYRAAVKKFDEMQDKSGEELKEWLSEIKKLEEQIDALCEPERDAIWKELALCLNKAIAKMGVEKRATLERLGAKLKADLEDK